MKIAKIDAVLTFLKSLSAIVIKSSVKGASPPTNPSLSYFFTTLFLLIELLLHQMLIYIQN